VLPLTGLVDINRAQEALLAAMFSIAGGLPEDRAAVLAKSLVASRAAGPGANAGPRYEAVEDLLQLPGVDFDLYARLSPIVTTESLGSGRVNPMAAPAGVLLVLSGGNSARAAVIAAGRDTGQVGLDTTQLTAQFLDNAVTTRFRIEARVPLPDGRHLLSTRWADTKVGPAGAPWRIFHSMDRIEPLPNKTP
jgi:general secretion pathway protein K